MKRLFFFVAVLGIAQPQTNPFDLRGDLGITPKTGSLEFDAASGEYKITGGGAVAHRKAVLMVRQDLTPGSAYADVALHGDGLTSLQYRPAAGGATLEVRSTVTGPTRIRIERRGNNFTIAAGKPGDELVSAGPQQVTLTDPVYVGLG